jgi:radical SAM superfamily enzyme YgiQ (UPF0313 family)
VMFYTEASMDLARKPALVDAMVRANFFYVFLGIESPSKESLREVKKLQNLAMDPLQCVELLQQRGLWVTGGFILGFDSDTEEIFEQQIEFIERSAIPWALLNFLHALPRTALHSRMQKEGRMLESRGSSSDGTPPNFRTTMNAVVLLRGFGNTISSIYEPEKFYLRALRSLERWQTTADQRPAQQPTAGAIVRILARSLWHQGLRSNYRLSYWRFFLKVLCRYATNRSKMWLAVTMLISGHHFIPYAGELMEKSEQEMLKVRQQQLGRREGAGLTQEVGAGSS